MQKPKLPANIEQDQKLDSIVLERLAKVIEVLPDIEQ